MKILFSICLIITSILCFAEATVKSNFIGLGIGALAAVKGCEMLEQEAEKLERRE